MKLAEFLDISNKLKNKRKEFNITQREMATKLDLSYSAYSNYENGYSEPPAEVIDKFCNYLNISIADLLGFSSKTYPKIKTYADLFSIFFQLEEMHIPISYEFYSEPEPISKKTRLGSKIIIDIKNPQISTFISAWNAKKEEKMELEKIADNEENPEYLKTYTDEKYEEWKKQILTLFNIPID